MSRGIIVLQNGGNKIMSGSLSYADDDVEELEHHLAENETADIFVILKLYISVESLRCVAYILLHRHHEKEQYRSRWYTLSGIFSSIICYTPYASMAMLNLISCFTSNASAVHNVSSIDMKRARMLVKHGYPVDYECKSCLYNGKQNADLDSLRVYATICKRVRERCRRCAATIMCAWRIAKDVRRMIAKMVWEELKMDKAWNYYKPK